MDCEYQLDTMGFAVDITTISVILLSVKEQFEHNECSNVIMLIMRCNLCISKEQIRSMVLYCNYMCYRWFAKFLQYSKMWYGQFDLKIFLKTMIVYQCEVCSPRLGQIIMYLNKTWAH